MSPGLARRALLVCGLAVSGVIVAGPALAQVIELTMVLRTIQVRNVDDGCDPFAFNCPDRELELYGRLAIDGATAVWNDHRCEGGGCLVTGNYTTDIYNDGVYEWRNMWLSVVGGPFRTTNNLIVLRRSGAIAIAQALRLSFVLTDHDALTADDRVCFVDTVVIPAGRVLANWLGPSSSHTIRGTGTEHGQCTITLQVFGRLISLR